MIREVEEDRENEEDREVEEDREAVVLGVATELQI